MKLQTVLFLFFFQILRFEIGGAAYLWMRLIHGRLRYWIQAVLEIRKKSRLPLAQMLDNQAPDFGCPDENLVALNNFSMIFA